MARLTALYACIFGVAAMTAGLTRAEYDSGGVPTNPAEIQANCAQAHDVTALDPADKEEARRIVQAFMRERALARKLAPAKKPLPKPPANARPVNGY
jgi:hypothetical protein